MRRSLALAATLVLVTLGRADEPHPRIVLGPVASTQYQQAFSIHGIGGDELLLFALQPADVPDHPHGVYVSRRGDGAHVGAVTAPPGGWGAPLAMKIVDYQSHGLFAISGSMLILDGFTPQQAGTRPGIVYEYRYSYSLANGLSTTLTATHALPMFTGLDASGLPNGPIYPISLARLPGGQVVVIDFLGGTIWILEGGAWRLAMVDPRFGVAELTAPIHGIGRAPGGGTRPYVFSTVAIPPQFPFPILPGIHGVAYCVPTREVAVLRTATPGGIFGIPLDALLDTSVPPFAKPTREIVAPTPGLSDLSVGLDYDRFHPDTPWLYWQRSVANAETGFNTVYRVHLVTGEIERLVESLQFYDWTNEISVLPSHLGPHFTVMTNANMQEENAPESNALLNGVPTLVGPSIVPIAAFSNW